MTGQLGAQALPPDAIARFHINNANYMTDVGKYLEALEELETAYDFSTGAEIKAEAASLKGLLLASFFDNPTAAAAEYNGILQNFPASAFYAPAMFQSAMLSYQTGNLAQARTLFQRYIREFPNGAQSTTAEFLLDQIPAGDRAVPAPPKPPAPATGFSRILRIALKASETVKLSSTAALVVDGKTSGASLSIAARDIPGTKIVVTSAGRINVDGHAYRGSVVLFPKDGSVLVVNEVRVEEYLYSVVGSEVSASWPAEALKAQAVAARTYAYYHILHPRSPGEFDVYDDTRSQVYGGSASEHATVRAAVDATRGQVLMYQNKPILAYFTSNNGGTMAEPDCIFGTDLAYFKPNKDDFSTAQPLGKWTRRFPVAAVEEALRKAGYSVQGIRAIRGAKSCASGRLVDLIIEHQAGELRLKTRTQFRRAINDYIKPALQPENMPEILMAISIQGDQLEISGGGWGHGVGLSQYGAKGMAEAKQSYSAILKTYYVGADLKTLDE